ncbi:MAG: SDR family oxidoreductase [SAR202 cluster bacterium]|nr:SDR family oxidoreductase [SAR202 cluster bacterium]
MQPDFTGKVALVTGGGSGIGRATAIAFASRGARVAVADIAAKGGQETVSAITKVGRDAFFVQADVAKAMDVEGMVCAVVERCGRLDFAVNNAGVGSPGGLTHEYTEADFDRILDINLKGVWLCMKYELDQMLVQGGGAIVNMASVVGLVGFPEDTAYAASKHGVVGLTRVAALEYASQGVRINCVCPGPVRTPIYDGQPDVEAQRAGTIPIGRFGDPKEVAEAIVWLCSSAASYVHGSALVLDGGFVAQ